MLFVLEWCFSSCSWTKLADLSFVMADLLPYVVCHNNDDDDFNSMYIFLYLTTEFTFAPLCDIS